jgi:glucan-binding YG repeat protein
MTKHVEVAATCTEDGNSAYWSCDVCNKYFADEQGTTEIAKDSWIIAAGHKIKKQDAKAPTCTVDGNTEHWSCEKCHKCFTDETGSEEIKKDSCVIPATGHKEVIDKAVAATTTSTGLTEGSHCSVCGTVLKKQQTISKLQSTTTKPQPEPTPEPEKKYSSEWIEGKWYNEDGTQTYEGTITWKSNSTGWWIEDTTGWYPADSLQKIDGKCYYFKPDGYMAESEYYNGYWFNSDGTMDETYYLTWKSNSTGWWVEDKSGWWPSSQWLKIDGSWYYFDGSGYMVTSQYVDGYWIGANGICQ